MAGDASQCAASPSVGPTRLHHPRPTSEAASAVMRGNTRRDTKPELLVRSEIHRRGLRYRVDHAIETASRRVRPDVVFTTKRIAIFIDGCFWHVCPQHGTSPGSNSHYWSEKLCRNQERDRAVDSALTESGWMVCRFWEHEDPSAVADKIEDLVRAT